MTVAIVILAAGMSSRMGNSGAHKLLANFGGVPLLRKMVLMAVATSAASVTVVLGHRHDEMQEMLSDLDVQTVINPDYASGMASSLIAGFSSTKVQSADGVLVLLADMPGITSNHLNTLIAAFEKAGQVAIIRAAADGKPGNPVILPRSLSNDVADLQGDIGARHLIKQSGLPVIDVEIGPAAAIDVDTPDDIAAAGGILQSPHTPL